MNPAVSGSATMEREEPSTTRPKVFGFGPRPPVQVNFLFGTVDEARDFLSRIPGSTAVETRSCPQCTTQSNVPTSNADNHSPADASSSVESAPSNLCEDPAQDHSIEHSSCLTSADLDPAVKELKLGNNNVMDELDELSLQKSAEEENVPEDNDGQPVANEDSPPQEPQLSNASSNLTASFYRFEEHLKECYESEKRKLEGCFQILRTRLKQRESLSSADAAFSWSEESFKECRELKEDQLEKKYQTLHTLVDALKIRAEKHPEERSDIQLKIDTLMGVATERGTEKWSCDTEMTESASDGNTMRLEASEMTAAEKTSEQDEVIGVNLLRDLSGGASILGTPFPKNPSDQKDWRDIEAAMIRGNAPVEFAQSFLFRGRWVDLEWNYEHLYNLREDYIRAIMLENRIRDAQRDRDPVIAGASPSTSHDLVEEVKEEDVECSCGDPPEKNKKGKVQNKIFVNKKVRIRQRLIKIREDGKDNGDIGMLCVET